jgi:hypothetical protein
MQHAQVLVIRLAALALLALQATTAASTWTIVPWQIARTMQHARMALMNTDVYVGQRSKDPYAKMM